MTTPQPALVPLRALASAIACLLLAAVSQTAIARESSDSLADQFSHPPEYAKPWTWWHWVAGNVTKEGITADLEAMKKIGVGGAQIFTVDQSDVKGPVKFMSPQWRDLVKYALKEANRLHLVISMEGCDGWSETGGPWVPVSESMQKVVWTTRTVAGGGKVKLDLPQPETIGGYYVDIGMCAYPAPAGSSEIGTASKWTASDPAFDGSKLPAKLNGWKANDSVWFQREFATPTTFRSVRFDVDGGRDWLSWQMQTSDDGVHFKKLADARSGLTMCFDPVTTKFLRVRFARVPWFVKSLAVTRFDLGGPVLDKLEARTGIMSDIDANKFIPLDSPADEVIDPKSLVNLTGRHEWEVPAGNWLIVRMGHTSTGATTHPSTTAGLECNKLDPIAVGHHVQNMFGPVIADSPSMVGNTFKNILLDSWEAGCENWTPRMAIEFQKRRGYDLTPWLPTLTGKIVGTPELTERFLWDYRRTLADLVAEEHYKVIQDYAHQRRMGLASEAAGIGMPTVADQLLCKKYTDIPMGEFWTGRTFDGVVDDIKEAASAAHIYGKPIAGAESFTSDTSNAAWKNDPYSLKALGDHAFCIGINRYMFHRYAHQPWLDRLPGMSMGPWGINFERTNTWWEPGSAWISYITRCEYLLQQGRFAADLCYFYGEGAPVCVHHLDLQPTPPKGYDYDVCNADVLLNSMTVEDGMISLASGMHYRVLVLPPGDRMTFSVLKKVASLVKAGATVYGPKPLHSSSLPASQDAEIAKLAGEVWGNCDGTAVTEHAYGRGKIIWGQPIEKALAVAPDFAPDTGNLIYIHRKAQPTDIYFVSNQDSKEVTAQCTFRVTGKVPELFHPDTGAHEAIALYKADKEGTTVPLHLDPSGSVFVIFRENVPAAQVADMKLDGHEVWTTNERPQTTLPCAKAGKIEFTAFQGGAYQLAKPSGKTLDATIPALPQPQELTGSWAVTFPPKLGAPASATFDSLISWTDSSDDGVKYFSGTATYRKDFSAQAGFIGKNRRVYLDLGTVKNLARVILNGKDLGVLWKAPFQADITAAIKPGDNHLEVKITNLWPNRLIGDQKLPEEKRITWASVSLYKADSPLLPSGLIGPVTIIPAESISL